MKKILILTVSLFVISFNVTYSQDAKYSHDAILIYNSGVALHNQGKYEQAEKNIFRR